MKNLDTKQIIKNAAFSIITNEVSLPFNMRSIQKVSNLSPGTIYYHYESKTSIILDLVEDFWKSVLNKYDNFQYSDDLISSLESFYLDIREKYLFFEKYYVSVLNKLTDSDKKIGRGFELIHLNKIKSIIQTIIENNKKEIKEEVLNVLGLKRIIDFIYENFISSLKLNNDILNYLFIVRKIIL